MTDKDLESLTEVEIAYRLKVLPGWRFVDNKIFKTYIFNSFTEVVKFIDGLVGYCNAIDHHPDILINYKKITFELTRFSVGGKVTARDFAVAKKIESDYQNYKKSLPKEK